MITKNFALGKIKEEVYNKLINNCEKELIDFRAAKAELGNFHEDLDKFVSFGLTLLTNLSDFYKNAGVEIKTKLLGSIFSEKLQFFENTFRTLKFNDAITLLCRYNDDLGRLGKKKGGTFKSSSRLVPRTGIEPVLLRTGV